MDINQPINYIFPYHWSGMKGQPIINRLMKAIIEENISEMYSLVHNGASINCLDQETIGRVLFNKISNHEIAKFLIYCGARGYYDGNRFYNECYDDNGYRSGGMALAYYYNCLNVFELLAENGFNKTSICLNGHLFELLELIVRNDDADALKLLLENGFSRIEIEWAISKEGSSRCSRLLRENPVIHRKSAALEGCLIREIKAPQLKTPKLFHKKENQMLIADYQDRIAARDNLMQAISPQDKKRMYLR